MNLAKRGIILLVIDLRTVLCLHQGSEGRGSEGQVPCDSNDESIRCDVTDGLCSGVIFAFSFCKFFLITVQFLQMLLCFYQVYMKCLMIYRGKK